MKTLNFFFCVFIISAIEIGCYKNIGPSIDDTEANKEMIPLGINNQWDYRVTGFDSLFKTSINATDTESHFSYGIDLGHGPTFLWDSVLKQWMSVPYNHGYIHEGNNWGMWSQHLIYTPYQDGEEKGLLCGYDMLDSGARYWFRIPRKPIKSITFSANSIKDIERGDTASGVYTAFIDTMIYQIVVPAGSFHCYKLLLRFDGEIGIGALAYLHTIDTLYLTPGKGIIKRIMSETDQVQDPDATTFSYMSNYSVTYELTSLKIK